VSIPDSLFQEAEGICRRLKLAGSRLYAQALQALVRRHAHGDLTKRLDKVAAAVAENDPGWETPGLEVLRREKC
jgi:hypothetical protein